MYGQQIANHFVASRKGSPFIKAWHDVWIALWKNRQNFRGLSTDPLMAFANDLTFDRSQASDFHWDFQVEPLFVFEYIGQVLSWTRICVLDTDIGNGISGVDYWATKVLIWKALGEQWGAEQTIGFGGPVLFNALQTRLDADPESEQYKDAYRMTWRVLSKSCMQKITHGKNLTKTKATGVLWEEEGNERKDCIEGTFGELLRYGSVHFEQTREGVETMVAERPLQTIREPVLG